MRLVCCICFYYKKPADLLAEHIKLTVMNGQMICVEHMPYVQGGEHTKALKSALQAAGVEPNQRNTKL